jgi:hypothetical protein
VNRPFDRSISVSFASLDFYPLGYQNSQLRLVSIPVIDNVWEAERFGDAGI